MTTSGGPLGGNPDTTTLSTPKASLLLVKPVPKDWMEQEDGDGDDEDLSVCLNCLQSWSRMYANCV